MLPGGTLRGHARAGGGPFIRGHTSRLPRRSSSGAARRCCQAAGGRALHSLPPSIPPFFGWGISSGLTEPRAKPATTTAKPEKPAHEPRSHPGPTNPVHIQGPRTPFTSGARGGEMPSPGPPCMHPLLRSLGTTPPSESDWDAVLAKDGELPSPERAKRVVQPPTTGRLWITRTTRTGRWRRTNQTTLWRGRAEFRRRLGFM